MKNIEKLVDRKALVGMCGSLENKTMFKLYSQPAYQTNPTGIDVEMALGDTEHSLYQVFSMSPQIARELSQLLLDAALEYEAKMVIVDEQDRTDIKQLLETLEKIDEAATKTNN